MFQLERVEDNFLMVDDAPGLDVNVLQQGPAYNVIIRHEPWSCCYLVQIQMCYVSEFSCISVVLFFSRVFLEVDDFTFQNLKNLCPSSDDVCGSWRGVR